MLARHEETRAMRFDNTKSLAFGLRTLLAVALHQYVEEHVDSDSQSCPQSAQLKLYQKRMAGVGKQAEGCDCEPCFFKQISTKISISPARNNGKKQHSGITVKKPQKLFFTCPKTSTGTTFGSYRYQMKVNTATCGFRPGGMFYIYTFIPTY